jgi:hypothetical protein
VGDDCARAAAEFNGEYLCLGENKNIAVIASLFAQYEA